MSEMNLQESLERYKESLSRAASRARELGKLQNNSMWERVATQLEIIKNRGCDIAKARGLTKSQIDIDIDIYKKKEAEKLN